MTRLSRQVWINKNNIAFAKERLHGIVFYLYREGTLSWNVCFKHRFSMNDMRRICAVDHLVGLVPPQQRHFSQLTDGGAMGAFCQFELPLREGRTAGSQKICIHPEIAGQCLPDSRVLWDFVGKNIHDRPDRDPRCRGQLLFSQPLTELSMDK